MPGRGGLISRRRAIAAMMSASAATWNNAQATAGRFAIVTASRDAAYGSAVEAIHGGLVGRSFSASVFRLPADEVTMRQELAGGAYNVIVAVGIEAFRSVAMVNSRLPIVATMVFRADMGTEMKPAGAVWLDLPVSTIVTGLHVAFPDATKLGFVRSPAQADSAEAPEGRTLPAGVSVKPVGCATAAELLSSIRTLRGKVEFLICLPDATLYNRTTVEPLILASIEHKVPLVGFSASFTRAGAAVGVYPDFVELGRQTAALCERYLGNPGGTHEETPRRTTVAVNERVLHLLGRECKALDKAELVVIK